MDRQQLEQACSALPLFPLPGVMLMPGTTLPLHVFEPRYRQLVQDCVAGPTPLALPQIVSSPDVDLFGTPPIHPYAGVGFVRMHHALPDGRYNIFVQGVTRARIEEVPGASHPYRVGRAELLEDDVVPPGLVGRMGMEVRALVAPLLARAGDRARLFLEGLNELAPDRVPDALAAMVLRDDHGRQEFLGENSPIVRAEMVHAALLVAVAENRPGQVAEA